MIVDSQKFSVLPDIYLESYHSPIINFFNVICLNKFLGTINKERSKKKLLILEFIRQSLIKNPLITFYELFYQFNGFSKATLLLFS